MSTHQARPLGTVFRATEAAPQRDPRAGSVHLPHHVLHVIASEIVSKPLKTHEKKPSGSSCPRSKVLARRSGAPNLGRRVGHRPVQRSGAGIRPELAWICIEIILKHTKTVDLDGLNTDSTRSFSSKRLRIYVTVFGAFLQVGLATGTFRSTQTSSV